MEWGPIKGNREYYRDLIAKEKEYESEDKSTSELEEQEGQGEARFLHLKELGFYAYASDFNKRTMEYILKNSPNLEILFLRDAYQSVSLKPLSSLLFRYCPRIMHLYVLN
jgi:hypothetical protein